MLVSDFLSLLANKRAAAGKGVLSPPGADMNGKGLLHTHVDKAWLTTRSAKTSFLAPMFTIPVRCSWTAVRVLHLPSALDIGLPVFGFVRKVMHAEALANASAH